jgi:hypothetical protein
MLVTVPPTGDWKLARGFLERAKGLSRSFDDETLRSGISRARLSRLPSRVPSLSHPVAVERPEQSRDEDEYCLVEGARDRQESDDRKPSERSRNPAVGCEELDRPQATSHDPAHDWQLRARDIAAGSECRGAKGLSSRRGSGASPASVPHRGPSGGRTRSHRSVHFSGVHADDRI